MLHRLHGDKIPIHITLNFFLMYILKAVSSEMRGSMPRESMVDCQKAEKERTSQRVHGVGKFCASDVYVEIETVSRGEADKERVKAKTEEKANPYTGSVSPGNSHGKDSKGVIMGVLTKLL